MKKNMGTTDRTIRILIAVTLSVLYFTGVLGGGMGIAALIVAGVMLLTSLIGFCPLYTLVGISSCKV
jgi:hypothetical protein